MSPIRSGGWRGASLLASVTFLFTGVGLRFEAVRFWGIPWFLVAGVLALVAGLVGFIFGAITGELVRWRARVAPSPWPTLQATVVGAGMGSTLAASALALWLSRLVQFGGVPVEYYLWLVAAWSPYLVAGLAYGILVALAARAALDQSGQGGTAVGDRPREERGSGSWAVVGGLAVILVVAVVWTAWRAGE